MMKGNIADFNGKGQFYVNKTGLELFDAIREIGLLNKFL